MTIDLLVFDEHEDPKGYFSHIYRAYKSNQFGMTEDMQLVCGLVLGIANHGNGWDALEDMIENTGGDCIEFIIFPEEGLIEGAYYESRVVNESRDWESGFVDDWDVEIVRILL